MTLLAYGIYIPWLGLYGDDWLYLWNYHLLGPQSFVSFVAIDRPFSAWKYLVVTAILREQVWANHVLALALRFLDVLALWWVLSLIWPKQKRQVLTVVLLFAIYPGFKQQAIPIEFILHFTILGLFMLSLGWMILAVRSSSNGKGVRYRLLFLVLSVLAAGGMFSIEYFVGLELIRPIVLWLALRSSHPNPSKCIRLILTWYWPYVLLLGGFIYWRLFIYKLGYYQPVLLDSLKTLPGQALINLARQAINDIYLATIGAWSQVFAIKGGLRTLVFFIAMVGISLVSIGWLVIQPVGNLFGKTNPNHPEVDEMDPPGDRRDPSIESFHTRLGWPLQAALLGIVSLVVAGIPFWVTGISVSLNFPWDRATLPFMLGTSLLLASVLELALKPKYGQIVLVVLVALSIGTFAKNARTYINDRAEQRQLIWQLIWRAPQIKPGTILVTEKTSLDYVHDNALTPIINWSYAPDLASDHVPYTIYELAMRRNTPSEIDVSTSGTPIVHAYRTIDFHGSTSEMLIFSYNSPSCLRIIRPEDTSELVVPETLIPLKDLSQLNQISINSDDEARPPLSLRREPEHTWCYYFEMADLARQQRDWQGVADLWESAASQSLKPSNSSEYEPFIEAYATLGHWDKALEMSEWAVENPLEQDGLCALWSDIEGSMTQGSQDFTKSRAIIDELQCPAR